MDQTLQNEDLSRLAQKMILLHYINDRPELPSENLTRHEIETFRGAGQQRIFTLKQERRLAEVFALLAANSDDPGRVTAACIEECQSMQSIKIKVAVNKGELVVVKEGLQRIASILQRSSQQYNDTYRSEHLDVLREIVSLHHNRILCRLRSTHAKMRCNFKKTKSRRPSWLPELCQRIKKHNALASHLSLTSSTEALRLAAARLATIFQNLERLEAGAAASAPGLQLLIEIVQISSELATHTGSGGLLSSLLGESKTLRKVGRYSRVTDLLVRYSQKFKSFRDIEIVPIKLQPARCLSVKPEKAIDDATRSLFGMARGHRLRSAAREAEAEDATEFIRHAATLKYPIHAEIQLLLHYEITNSETPPRIICSNKKACFLCNLFFRLHGTILVPSSHGRLYEKWTLPVDLLTSTLPRCSTLFRTVWAFGNEISRCIAQQLSFDCNPFPQPDESIIFPSRTGSSLTVVPRSEEYRTHDGNGLQLDVGKAILSKLGSRPSPTDQPAAAVLEAVKSSINNNVTQSKNSFESRKAQTAHSLDARLFATGQDGEITTYALDKALPNPVDYKSEGDDMILSAPTGTLGIITSSAPLSNRVFSKDSLISSQAGAHLNGTVKLRRGASVALSLTYGVHEISVYTSKIHLILAMAPKRCTHKNLGMFTNHEATTDCTCQTFVQVEWLQED